MATPRPSRIAILCSLSLATDVELDSSEFVEDLSSSRASIASLRSATPTHQLPSPKTVRCWTITCRTSVSRFLPYQRTLFPLSWRYKEPSHPISGSINGVRNAATAIPQALTARRQRAFSDSRVYL